MKVTEATGLPTNDYYKRSGPSQMTDDVKAPELGHLIRCLATDPNVVKFWWEQYTPYFNDGDVCEFSVRGELNVQTIKDVEDEDGNLEVGDYHPTLGASRYVKTALTDQYGNAKWEKQTGEKFFPLTRVLADNLNAALQKAEVTLLEWFGDHARVEVSKDGIVVDEFEHD